jgi:hypothetical protein
MQRRKSIKNIALLAGGLIALPSWAKAWSLETLPPMALPPLPIAEGNTLALIIEAIIPESETKGAKSLGVPAFINTMLADCYEKKVVENVEKSLTRVEGIAQAKFQQGFAALPMAQKQALLLEIEKGEDKDLKDFYSLIKNLTIQGYTTSEYVQTTFLKYEMVPGHYYGCVPVKS